MDTVPATRPTHRRPSPSSRALDRAQILNHYKQQCAAAEYREAVYRRRIAQANDILRDFGMQINSDPWSGESIVTLDHLPVAGGV